MRILQTTLSGKDAGGYIFQNVGHFSTDDDDTEEFTVLSAMNAAYQLAVIDPYTAAANESVLLLNIASRFVSPSGSYSVNLPINEAGIQAGDPSVGALCGKVGFYPATGSRVGRIFVAGPIDANFTNDQATTAYLTLLSAVGSAFVSFDGTGGPYNFQFGLWGKVLSGFSPLVEQAAIATPGVLSKRIRT